MFQNIYELKDLIAESVHELDRVYNYLNDAGKAKLEALRAIYFHANFYERLAELIESEDYLGLEKIEGKHMEYYRTLRMVNRRIKEIVY